MKAYTKPAPDKVLGYKTATYQQRKFAKKCGGCGNEMWNIGDHIYCQKNK